MKANGFFGNWAKYSMEKRMKNDEIYDESGFAIGSAGPLDPQAQLAQASIHFEPKNPDPLNKSDYFLCKADNVYDLERQVNKMIGVGYKPCGGVMHTPNAFYQAVFLDRSVATKDLPTYTKDYLHF